jgi:hypothetical protein
MVRPSRHETPTEEPYQPPQPAFTHCNGCGLLVRTRRWLGEARPPRWETLSWPVTPLNGYLHLCPVLPMPACATCGHEAADHVTGLCLHTLECLCKGYVPEKDSV